MTVKIYEEEGIVCQRSYYSNFEVGERELGIG